MTTLFVSDLHLDAARPNIVKVFLDFLGDEARQADALYVLGDLFEYWVGDDDPQPVAAQVADGLSTLAHSGVPVFFVRGNRDFLLGAQYAGRCDMRILPDPCVIDLYARPTLLLHGDLMCTDDTAYQAFRRQSRDPAWQESMLAQPLEARIAYAHRARAASIAHQQAVRGDVGGPEDGREDITDVSKATVEATFARYGIATMIHGHTHRPAIHQSTVGEQPCTRIVLGDWYEHGSVLRVDADGASLATL
ncbi:MAG TPA: UDP-2,3-diacylglucosamine diphosphatase [Xanthomonadaceae bacterium]|nr:UDP-2,3-diacylglucosamine diphosphatase [Xanthomonadaceae bacterium]